MCIVCNFGAEDPTPALDFLAKWDQVHVALKEATDAMLRVSQTVPDPAHRKRYGALHKRMVRQMHDWNRLEEARERVEYSE